MGRMTGLRSLSGPRAVTVAGLMVGAVGIAVLWASGRIVWPIYPPPGIVNLLIGAVVVALVPRRWALGLGVFLGLFLFVGFVISGGPPNLVGRHGATVAIGNWIMILAGLTAVIAGVRAMRIDDWKPGQTRR